MIAVYLLRCADSSLYCGIARDLKRRLAEHNGEAKGARGAKYTRSRRPVALAWHRRFRTLSAALRAEHALKCLTRKEKLALVAGTLKWKLRPTAPKLKSKPRNKKKVSSLGASHRPSKARAK